METANIYLVYYEQTKDGASNGFSVQCDTIPELIYALKQAQSEKQKNVIIHTIQNGKQQ